MPVDGSKLLAVRQWNKLTSSIESEKTLLGGLLLDCNYFSSIDKMLCCADFASSLHQKIFDTMWRVFRRRNGFDVPMIADELQEETQYLYELANNCASTNNLMAHAEIIREKSVQRQLAECAEQIRQAELEREDESQPLQGHPLGKFFIELGYEINAIELDSEYLHSLLFEVNKAIVHQIECEEDCDE